MNNLEELTLKIKNIIESERAIHPEDIQYLNASHSALVAQIISSYNLKPSSEKMPQADMVVLGAPTGAGKDTLVRKIIMDNPEKNFIVLNMDMFRHYHDEILGSHEDISDKQFARKTNQTSYELYYIIEQTILKEFPGTNIIVTGTIKDLPWVKEIVERYKNDPKTNYAISLVTLAVPTNESAFSIFERYLSMVDTRESDNVPLRYTDLTYHNETIRDFISNVSYFENDTRNNRDTAYFNSIKVYRRHKDMFDLSEDTLLYDSETSPESETATNHLRMIMTSRSQISSERISNLLNIVKRNSDYLKSQGLYDEIGKDLAKVLPQLSKSPDDIEK